MGSTGGGGHGAQAPVAGELGGGDPTMRPANGDRRAVPVQAITIVVGLGALILLG